jgi:hypothetical protein
LLQAAEQEAAAQKAAGASHQQYKHKSSDIAASFHRLSLKAQVSPPALMHNPAAILRVQPGHVILCGVQGE